ncbi:unnamed protein product [Gongylonema pulchrum]|uniref:BPTI/Kunitz inhibitor domain-containing protein n=1 Tax=Gongylonema pulchrum TaxID=637853 RepID=A0A183EGV7_9BILA|nr:unnamed protein product [Gongylonema pulchrum]
MEFEYHGMQGNENNFLNYSECKHKCMSTRLR